MPPIIVWVLSAVGAATVVQWARREVRRINAELHPDPHDALASSEIPEGTARLRRGAEGIYRPE